MSEPADLFPRKANEPEPWDRAGALPAVPFVAQEKAIEELLRDEPGPMPFVEIPADLYAATPAALPEVSAPKADPDALVEEFKPTDGEWENVKELLVPHESPLEENLHPTFKPEILERDAEGRDGGGDWNTVETERSDNLR